MSDTPEPSEGTGGTRYAGFWIRVAAALIDSALVAIILTPIILAIYGREYFTSTTVFAGPADVLLTWVLPAAAIVVFWIYRSATPGKLILGMRIVDANSGQPLGARQSIARYLAYYVSLLPLGLGMIWIAFDARKQGFHDKLARTVVLRSVRRSNVADLERLLH